MKIDVKQIIKTIVNWRVKSIKNYIKTAFKFLNLLIPCNVITYNYAIVYKFLLCKQYRSPIILSFNVCKSLTWCYFSLLNKNYGFLEKRIRYGPWERCELNVQFFFDRLERRIIAPHINHHKYSTYTILYYQTVLSFYML